MDTNKIEKELLDREIGRISADLGKIGEEIAEVFSRYGKINGNHGAELRQYIAEKICGTYEHYYAGYTTAPACNAHAAHIPECVKTLVLEWAVKAFFDKFEEVKSVVSQSR